MTPEERALRDAWLSEMWAPVREYLAPIDPRAQVVEKPAEKRRKDAA